MDQEDCMTNLVLHYVFGPETAVFANYGLWVFLSIGAIALFGIFIPTVTWIDSRRKEREAFYKAETFRRMAESSGEGARGAVEMLREEERIKLAKTREGLKIGGLINIGVGVSLVIFLSALLGTHRGAPYLCGLIPAFIGIAMLVYVYFLAEPPL
jgi:hypothetical protein